MKKANVWLLVLLLALSACAPALAQEVNLENLVTIRSVDLVDDQIGVQAGTSLTIGTTTAMSGYFATDMWGTNTADMDVRKLLHGYNTIAWLQMQGIMFNGGAVAGSYVQQNARGNREYIISLMTDMTYNDGTPLTARDYVFSLLLSCAPEVAQIGGTPRGYDFLYGYDEYASGQTDSLAGIRMLSEDTISLEIKQEYLPSFYGLAMLEVIPYPIDVIAPGCDVFDSSEGVRIGKGESAVELSASTLGFAPGEFSAEMLQKTLLDPETGYVFNPRVTSGPYALESVDLAAQEASFVLNAQYKGNYEGKKPHIERLVFRFVDDADVVDALQNGEIDLANKVGERAVIESANAIATGETAPLTAQNYLRSGLSFMAFACDKGATTSEHVRRAIAHCIDKTALVDDPQGTYGVGVHGYYGMGQWMATYAAEENAAEGLRAIDVPVEREALAVPFDLEEAKRLLDEAGWIRDEYGNHYEEGEGKIRHREENGVIIPLTIRWAKTEGNNVADLIERYITPTFAEVGIGLEVVSMPFTEVLAQYYRATPSEYNMFFLATNFQEVFDPYYEYHVDEAYAGLLNTSGLHDVELMNLAKDMRETVQTDLHAYAIKWMAFQERWAALMPMVPLYSNIYFDFFIPTLQGYDITLNTSWADAIHYAYIGDAPVETGEVEFQTVGDGADAPVAGDEPLVVIDDL